MTIRLPANVDGTTTLAQLAAMHFFDKLSSEMVETGSILREAEVDLDFLEKSIDDAIPLILNEPQPEYSQLPPELFAEMKEVTIQYWKAHKCMVQVSRRIVAFDKQLEQAKEAANNN